MKKVILYSLSGFGAILIIVGWLFFGIFQDREFATLYLFRKHRATLKIFFYAPLGESDNQINSLSPRKQNEEKAFNEFVYSGGGYNRRIQLFSY